MSRGDLMAVLALAQRLKRNGVPPAMPLRGKNFALLNEAANSAGAITLQRAATDLGARVSRLRPSDSNLNRTDDVRGTARLLGRLYDAIDCEGLDDRLLEHVEHDAGVPVFNGLAGPTHPARVIAMLLALQERSGKPLDQLRVAFVGDARTLQAQAWLQAAALTGMELRIAAPRATWPSAERMQRAHLLAQGNGAKLRLLESVADAREGADMVVDADTPVDDDCQRFTLQALLLSAMA